MLAWFDGKEWHYDPQPLVWRHVARLSPGQLATVRAAIESSGFMTAPSRRRSSWTSVDGSKATWTATSDGRRHTVVLSGVPVVSDPAVDVLQRAMESAIARALNRAAGD
jgi:hypothetical protein